MHLIRGIEERVLVERIQQKDKTAFELIFNYYYAGLVVYCTQFTAEREEAESIVQDFFVQVWTNSSTIDASLSLKNYSFSAIKNRSLNFLKHKKIQEKYVKETLHLSETNLLYDPDLYISSELQERIKQAVDALPEKCREVFIMNRFKGIKNDEIAETLNISKRTVETHISNALKVLRHELKDYLLLLIFFKII